MEFVYLTIFNLLVLSSAYPSKYPYVFLLDIGNEELEKTNSEQIRLSVPGGSLAVRYPAVGDGDMITHMRVTSIDFGTDLKASVIDGGPGYNYVVLVFLGNKGKPYDAVMTVQTMLNEVKTIDDTNQDSTVKHKSDNSVENDNDESSEEFGPKRKGQIQKNGNSHAELTQSSANVYKYATNEMSSNDFERNNPVHKTRVYYYNDNDNKNIRTEIYPHTVKPDQYSVTEYDLDKEVSPDYSEYDIAANEIENNDVNIKDYVEDDIKDYSDIRVKPDATEQTKYEDGNEENAGQVNPSVRFIEVNTNPGGRYIAKVYARDHYNEPTYIKEPFKNDESFDDEEIHDEVHTDGFRDRNNNNFDTDDSYAVAY